MAAETLTPSRAPAPPEGSVKETIESILVAFILAFIFRAFVVEAFVIPTGSMGPTLMGAHMRFDCKDCGYHFDVNFSTPKNADIPAYGRQPMTYHCPNCGFPVTPVPGTQVPIYFGDRILVLKYRYLFQHPEPFDVVVFKSPYEDTPDPRDPKYTENYIKRLVARPLEAAMILDGDVYIADHDEKDLTKFKIRRKPWHVQQALWRIVNDNDYIPVGLTNSGTARSWQHPWVVDAGSGWTGPRNSSGTGASRRFVFDNASGAGAFAFDPDANPAMHALTDWLVYDEGGGRSYPNRTVSDLKFACVYRRRTGSGPLRLQLTKRNDCFTAQFTPGKVTLLRSKLPNLEKFEPQGGEVLAQASVEDLDGSGPVRVELINVDYRVSVRVNGREVLATTDQQYAPDVARLISEFHMRAVPQARPFVRVEAAQQTCSIEHLSLWRDIYYLNEGDHYDALNHSSGEPFWASPDNVMRLGPDEYFVLGDNSEVSLDARYWGEPVDLPREGGYKVAAGRVPGRFMLGKAFFVYWPAGFRPPSLPYGVEPDFGDMRFIH